MFVAHFISSSVFAYVLTQHSLQNDYTKILPTLSVAIMCIHFLFALQNFRTIISRFFEFIFGVLFFHLIAILFGAPTGLFSSPSVQSTIAWETLLWSSMMSSLVVLGNEALSILKSPTSVSLEQNVHFYVLIVTTWASAFVIPLDWDRPWQVFPICTTYGLMFGEMLGTVASGMAYLLKKRKSSKQE
jgi:phosphatidylinositol glycan class F